MQAPNKTARNFIVRPSFRISETATIYPNRGAGAVDVTYNPDDNEYLVVWESDGLTELKGVNDIYGQRLNGITGERIGVGFRISTLTDGDKNHGSNRPKVVYNRTAHEYLVVWYGTGLFESPARFFEVYGQRISRIGKVIGSNFRISHTADLGKVNTNIVRSSGPCDVAWNSTNNEYLVIWRGMGEPQDVVKMEIYGQRLLPNGEPQGKSFRVSHTTDQGLNFHANAPAIAYNSKDNQYLVIWSGGFKNESQIEIWGTGLSAAGLALGAKNEFRISQVSDVGANRRTSSPRVVFNSLDNEYLVVFQANGAGTSEDVNDIFGQRINAATLAESGANDFRISNATGASNSASKPALNFNSVVKNYLVLWRSNQNTAYEISAREITGAGNTTEAAFQISNIATMGKDRTVSSASLTSNSANGEYFVVWQGNAVPKPEAAKVTEIFGQKVELTRSTH